MYDLVGVDGNAYSVMGYVRWCMKKEGKSKEDIKEYTTQAMASDYDTLLTVSIDMIDTLNNKE